MPIRGATKLSIDELRNYLPENTTATVIKNSLFKHCANGTEFSKLLDSVNDENMFVFIPHGQFAPSFQALNKWRVEFTKPGLDFNLRFGALENQIFHNSSLHEVLQLPPKLDLIAKFAAALKMVPSRLLQTLSAIPSKLRDSMKALESKLGDESARATNNTEVPKSSNNDPSATTEVTATTEASAAAT